MNALSRMQQAIGRFPPGAALWLFPVLIFLHNPQRLLLPEMWGEDGPIWYAEAYREGWSSLLNPAGSYLNSVQRLVAIAVQPLPLSWVPFLFQLASILIQAAPAIFLVSRRMDTAWPHRSSRFLFALLYLLMPNAAETAAGLTNSQWYLAILALLLVVSTPPSSFFGRLLETAVLLVAGLSGPFCFTIMPAALWEAFVADRANRMDAWRRVAILAVTCLVQGSLILFVGEGRNAGPLGASFDLFVRIVGLISLGAEVGHRSLVQLVKGGWISAGPLLYITAAASTTMVLVAMAKGPRLFTQFVIFTAAVLGLALASPLVHDTEPQWPRIARPPSGNRYYLFPMLAWWAALFVLAGLPGSWLRLPARLLLAITVFFAIPRDWGALYAFTPSGFVERAREFEEAPPGTTMEFRNWPGWKFSLTK